MVAKSSRAKWLIQLGSESKTSPNWFCFSTHRPKTVFLGGHWLQILELDSDPLRGARRDIQRCAQLIGFMFCFARWKPSTQQMVRLEDHFL